MLEFVRRARPLREPVARALMWEVGKPWPDCLKEFDRTIEYIEATAEALRQIEKDAAAPVSAGGFVARIRRAPLGVALCLGPYNYAVNEVFTTVIPALVMGNPVVMKTPRYGVLANALLVPALQESFPRGAITMVTGQGPTVVGPMLESGLVDVLALIGSARTASVLLKQHPHPYRLRTLLGMGAKNPAIVLQDADLDAAAAEIVSGALSFNGQRCTALQTRPRGAKGGRRPRRAPGRSRRAAEARHALGRQGHDHAAPGSAEARPPRPAGGGRAREGRACGEPRRGSLGGNASGPRSCTRCRKRRSSTAPSSSARSCP